MDNLDDTSGLHHQQELEKQFMEREYDIAFGSFAKDFKQFVEGRENVSIQKTNGSQN